MADRRSDYYYWRLFCTGLSFFNFGAGGLILRFVFVPLLSVAPISKQKKIQIGRLWMHRALKLFVWQMKSLGVLTYEVHGLEKIGQGQLLIANHPSLIDVVFLLALIPRGNCIVRKSLFTNPFTSGALNSAGYIPNCEPIALMDACKKSLAEGDVLIMFPEGTRTRVGQPLKLQRGAANIALEAEVEVVPVLIDCSENTLTKGEKWYHIPFCRPHWSICVGQPIGLQCVERTPKAARILTDKFCNYFNEEIKCH